MLTTAGPISLAMRVKSVESWRGAGDYERRGIRAVDLRFLTADLVRDERADQDSC
jgi:hypothetical protein